MPGVTADLELRAEQAQRAVTELDQALNRAVSGVGDQLLREIREVSGVVIDIGVDPAQIATEISGAVDAADTSVVVEAEVQGGVEDLAGDLADVGESAEDATSSINVMGGSLKQAAAAAAALVGARELTQFLVESTEAASNLGEQVSAAEVVFGDANGAARDFAETSATSIGAARDEALEMTNSLGGLLIAMGKSQAEAAELGPVLIQRAADLASLRNVAGGTTEVLEKFTSGLVGEAEPLRQFGVIINEQTVNAKALELGLGGVTGELTEQEKVQARLAIIMDATAVAQGNFALTADGLANAQRQANAEWRNAQIAIGEAFLPVALELVDIARRDLIPMVQDLATDLVPLLGEAFHAASPLMGTTFTLINAGLPALEVLVDLIEAIPDPVLQAIATFTALRATLGPIPGIVGNLAGALSRSGPGLAASFTNLLSPIGFVAGALTLVTAHIAEFNQKKEEQRRAIDEVREAFLAETEAIDNTTTATVRLKLEEEGQVDDLQRVGLSFEQFADLAGKGQEGLAQFLTILERSGEIDITQFGDVATLLERFPDAPVENFDSFISGNRDLVQSFGDLQIKLQGGARAAIETRIALEELGQEQADAAIEANTAADGTINYIGALEDLGVPVQEAIDNAGGLSGAMQDVTDDTRDARDEIDKFSQALQDTLDPFLTAEEATLRFRQAQRDLADEIAAGPEKGEKLVEFHERLRGSMLDVIDAKAQQAQALLDNGEFESAEEAAFFLRASLVDLAEQFPALAPLIEDAAKEIGGLEEVMLVQGMRIGGGLSTGIGVGITLRKDEAVQAARRVADEVIVVVSGALRLQSPSKVMQEFGANVSLGLALGIRDEIGAVSAASLAMSAAVIPAPLVPAFSVGLAGQVAGGASAAAAPGMIVPVGGDNVQVGPNYNVEMDPVLVAQHLARRVP